MSPADVIALPFIERDYETPSYDRKLALDRIRTRNYLQIRKKGRDTDVQTKEEEPMKRLTYKTVGDAFREPHYCHGPGIRKDDLLQRLGLLEDAVERIETAMRAKHSDPRTLSMIECALIELEQKTS